MVIGLAILVLFYQFYLLVYIFLIISGGKGKRNDKGITIYMLNMSSQQITDKLVRNIMHA